MAALIEHPALGKRDGRDWSSVIELLTKDGHSGLIQLCVQTAAEISTELEKASTLNDKSQVLFEWQKTHPEFSSTYLFIHLVLADRIVNVSPIEQKLFSSDVRFTTEETGNEEDVAVTGTLTRADHTGVPIRLCKINHNWKIDGILTPETSMLIEDQP